MGSGAREWDLEHGSGIWSTGEGSGAREWDLEHGSGIWSTEEVRFIQEHGTWAGIGRVSRICSDLPRLGSSVGSCGIWAIASMPSGLCSGACSDRAECMQAQIKSIQNKRSRRNALGSKLSDPKLSDPSSRVPSGRIPALGCMLGSRLACPSVGIRTADPSRKGCVVNPAAVCGIEERVHRLS